MAMTKIHALSHRSYTALILPCDFISTHKATHAALLRSFVGLSYDPNHRLPLNLWRTLRIRMASITFTGAPISVALAQLVSVPPFSTPYLSVSTDRRI